MGLIFPLSYEAEYEALANAWLSPRGELHFCAKETHNQAAQQILENKDLQTKNYDAILENGGWARIRDSKLCLTAQQFLTKCQKETISDIAYNADIPSRYRAGYLCSLKKYLQKELRYGLQKIDLSYDLPYDLYSLQNSRIAKYNHGGGYWHGDNYFKKPETYTP